jgi:hypothetical protein
MPPPSLSGRACAEGDVLSGILTEVPKGFKNFSFGGSIRDFCEIDVPQGANVAAPM